MQSILDLYTQEKKNKLYPKVKPDLTHAKWAIENLTFDKRIGIGTYSRVFRARTKTGEKCAVKILDDLNNQESVEYLKRLVVAGNLCSSRAHSFNVPQVYRFEDRTVWKGNSQVHQIIIIMEKAYCSLWEIHKEKIKTGSPWNQDHLIKILLSVCNALSEGMKRDLCHFDIHERNILVHEENSVFMLADFGIPKVIKRRRNRQPYQTDYLAPEAKGIKSLRENIDKYKADVYSLGLVILKLMTLKDQFKVENRGEIAGILEEKKNEYPVVVKILREQMLIEDPAKRDSFKNVKYMLITLNFDLSYSTTRMEDLIPKKTASGSFNPDMREEQSEIIDIGQAYEYFELYNSAKQEYNRALTSLHKYDDYSRENAEMRTICLARLGLIDLELEAYQSALDYFKRLHDYIKMDSVKFRLGNEHPLYTHIYQYIGVAFYSLNDLDKAMENFSKAHELGKTSPVDSQMNEKMCELYMGIVRFLKNDFAGCLKEMVGISDFIATLPQKDHFDNVDSLMMIGNYYRKMKAHNESLAVYSKAKELVLRDCDDDSDEYIHVMSEIATTHKEIKDYKNACSIQLSIIEKIRHSGDRKDFAQALLELADTLAKQEKLSEAIYTAEMAFKVFNRVYWLKNEKTVKAYKVLMSLLKRCPEHKIYKQYKMLEDLLAPEVEVKFIKKLS